MLHLTSCAIIQMIFFVVGAIVICIMYGCWRELWRIGSVGSFFHEIYIQAFAESATRKFHENSLRPRHNLWIESRRECFYNNEHSPSIVCIVMTRYMRPRLLFVYFNNEESKFRRNMIIPLLCLPMALITCCTCLTGTKICLHSFRVSIEISLIHGDLRRLNAFILECYPSIKLQGERTRRIKSFEVKLIQNSLLHILVSPTRTVSEYFLTSMLTMLKISRRKSNSTATK